MERKNSDIGTPISKEEVFIGMQKLRDNLIKNPPKISYVYLSNLQIPDIVKFGKLDNKNDTVS